MEKIEATLKRIQRQNAELREQLRLLQEQEQRQPREEVDDARAIRDRGITSSRLGEPLRTRIVQLDPIEIEGRVPRERKTPQASEEIRGTSGRLRQTPPQDEPPFWYMPAGQAIRESLQDDRTQRLVEQANRQAERTTRERYGDVATSFLREQRRRRLMDPADLPRTAPVVPWYHRPGQLTPREREWLRREPFWGNIVGIGVGILRSLDRLWESVEAIPELPEAIWALLTTLNSPEHRFDWRIRWELISSIVIEPLRAIATDIDAAVRAAKDGDQIESSARIIEATARVLEIISGFRAAVGSARQMPASVRRLNAFGDRLRDSPRLHELQRLLRDERGHSDFGEILRRRRRRIAAGGQNAFRRWLIRRLSQRNHPLRALLDPATGQLRRYSVRDIPTLRRRPLAFEMGHVRSNWATGENRFALQSAHWNQWDKKFLESRGGVVENVAIDLFGIPVEQRTALDLVDFLENLPQSASRELRQLSTQITRNRVLNAPSHPGWRYVYTAEP